MKQSVAQRVFNKLDADPYAKQAIKLGIANYSAIAKRLAVEGGSFHAVKAAVRRYAEGMKFHEYSKDIKKILKETKITLKSNIAVIFLFPGYDSLKALQKVSNELGNEFSMISSANGITLILDQSKQKKLEKLIGAKNIIAELEGMYLLVLTSPFEELETTPGWVAFLTELLAREGINIRDYYSCYTDTAFVLEKDEALRAYELFLNVLG